MNPVLLMVVDAFDLQQNGIIFISPAKLFVMYGILLLLELHLKFQTAETQPNIKTAVTLHSHLTHKWCFTMQLLSKPGSGEGVQSV